MKKKTSHPWFPLWIDKWLFGSTSLELEPDERCGFIGLIALSEKDSGYIRANVGVPYLEGQICAFLNISPELLRRTLEKCLKYKKIKKLRDGTLFILGHNVYKLTDRWKREITSEKKEVASEKKEVASEKKEVASKKVLCKGRGIEKEIGIRILKGRKRRSPASPPLPTIPKGLGFKVQDELKLQLAEIRQLRRRLSDKELIKKSPGVEKDILCKLEQKEKKYCDLIEDFS